MQEDQKDMRIKSIKMSEKESYSLSIVLPVFNVEKYLDRCIKSILEGTYKDLELVIVNDGTKDDSENIIIRYLEKYNNITYIVKENGGLSHARNVGYTYAKGEYIAFFDSDDYIEKDMYEKLMAKVKDYNYDIVVCDLYMEYEQTGKKIYVGSNVEKEYKNVEEDNNEINIRKEIMENIYIAVHNKIYKKELIEKTFEKGMPFVNGMYYEDIVYTYSILQNTRSISFVKEPLYYYVQRTSSISNNYDKKLYDIITSVEMLIENSVENNRFEDYKEILEYIGIRYMYGTFMKRIAKTKNKKIYLEGYNRVIQEDKKIYEKYGILGKNKKKNSILNNCKDYSECKEKSLRLKLKNLILKNMDKKLFANILFILEKNTKN